MAWDVRTRLGLKELHLWSYVEREGHRLHRRSHFMITKAVKSTSVQRGHPISFINTEIPIRRLKDILKSGEFMTVPNPSCIQLPDWAHEAANTLPTRGLTIVASIPSNTEWNIWFDSNSWGSLELTRSSAVTWNRTRIFAWWSINRTISTLGTNLYPHIFKRNRMPSLHR